MMDQMHQETNKTLEDILVAGDAGALGDCLATLLPGETARTVTRLNPEHRRLLLTLLPSRTAARLVEELPQAEAVASIQLLEPATAATILAELPSDLRADVINQLDAEQGQAILAMLVPELAEGVRRLSCYPAETAGGLMVTEYLAYPDSARVGEVIDDLRRHAVAYSGYRAQYAYVTCGMGELVGVLRLRDLLLNHQDATLLSAMVPDPIRVRADTSLDDLLRLFDRHDFFGLPVTDEDGRLLGVVLRVDVEEAGGERAERRYLLASGILGGEELRTMPWRKRLTRRLAWLAISAVLNLLAASVVGLFQDTLSAVIALAVFLPVISGMGGNSGNQALAVSIRELTLGVIKPNEFSWILLKEISLGLVNGLALGVLLAGVALVWKGSFFLALVVATAMMLSTIVAVCLGGTLPLALKKLNVDPALASGPILTTVTDMCGFLFALGLASMLLHHLPS